MKPQNPVPPHPAQPKPFPKHTGSSINPAKSLPHHPQQQQQQSAMTRFPSNIDAHLRPIGVYRPLNISPNLNTNPNSNPNSNLNSASIRPPNPNLSSQPHLEPKVNHTPPTQPQPPVPPSIDVWRVQSEVKRPFEAAERGTVSEDAFFTVGDRKVRISDRNAIYALCRSWLRNGYREESQFQPQHGDIVKSLPKPLPLPESSTPEKKETDNETDVEDENAAGVSAEELLQRHIKRAKKVRERLKEERMRRIKRYKSRLKLLLPPPIEQSRGENGPS